MNIWRPSLLVIVPALLVAGCGQDAPAPPADPFVEAAVPQAEAEVTPPIPEEATPPSTELAVERVEGLMISHPADQPDALVIFASGMVPSDGWTEPRLIPINPDQTSGTLSFDFVAISPEQEAAARAPRPVEARLEIEAFPQDVEMVRIVSATNELTAFVGN
nr:MAG: hypothetical protein E4H34_02030 [Hyphomicrobiales bacterium]